MDIFMQAGIFSLLALGAFLGGVGWTLRSRDPATSALGFAALILALGLVGAGMAQRHVETYVAHVDTVEQKVDALSMGTREATTNHLLSGGMAALLLAIGAMRRRSRTNDA